MLATIRAARMPGLIAGIMLMPCSLFMDCFQNVCVPANPAPGSNRFVEN